MLAARLPLAQGAASTYHRFARVGLLDQWWHWLLLLGACALIGAFVIWMYRRDTIELPRGVAVLLLTLRVLAFVGILVFFLNLEKRTERKLVKNSRAVVMVDTSQSMGLRDSTSTPTPAAPSRIEDVVNELAEGEFVQNARRRHDVVVYGFDEGVQPTQIAAFPKITAVSAAGDPVDEAQRRYLQSVAESRYTALAAAVLLLLSLLAGAVYLVAGRRSQSGESTSWALLASMVLLVASLVVLAVASLRSPEVNMLVTLGLEEPNAGEAVDDVDAETDRAAAPEVDWEQALTPRGRETRLGEALRYIVNKERGGPISGVVVFSDGGNNAGVEPSAVLPSAQDAGIPIYTVGLGSTERPTNARVVNLEAPQRVYPGDSFSVTGYVQAYGLEGRTVEVELLSGVKADGEGGVVEEQDRIALGADGELVPINFELDPGEPGKRAYQLRVSRLEQDRDPNDNSKTASVQVVERKNQVLLLAGGPTREFRFLRNLLFRDDDTTLHVWLQSGEPGISQESDELLFDFPSDVDEMFEYDAVVAFDPDWEALSDHQVELLEQWVADQAGGLVVVAGPIHTPQWSSERRPDDRIETIQDLYPVQFYSQGSATLTLGRFGGETAWPPEFSQDGLEAEFLWLEDDPVGSEAAWDSFSGVYGYYAVQDPKPGANVYARFSDPSTQIDGELPIYMAGHFYGAGRVFFLGSGEMWRIREIDDAYFQRFYTKLIRWASQGRLLRDSSRGVLLVDKDRASLGEQVGVRTVLTDPQHRPLAAPEVEAMVVQPDSTRSPLVLRSVKDAAREGMFAGQFTALQDGEYRVELRVPQSGENELLSAMVDVRAPQLEVENPLRNDPLLKEIADKTGGEYFVGVPAATGGASASRASVVSLLEPQDQETILPGTPDRQFDKLLSTWLMAFIVGVLCLEWLIRRVSKLA